MTRRPFLARLGASLAALMACPGCLKRAEAEPLPHVVVSGPTVDLYDIRPGDWIVCRNGHRIGEIAETFDDCRWPTVHKWQIANPPQVGTPKHDCLCDRCGESFADAGPLITERYWLRHGWPA